MDYLLCYYKLITCGKKERNLKPFEKHHIIPKSIFKFEISHKTLNFYKIIEVGDKNNIVKLTLKEHFLVHMLLVKIFEHVDKNCYLKMLHAYNIFHTRYKNSNNYKLYKEKYKKLLSENHKGKPSGAKGKKWSNEAKQKRKETHYLSGKTYEDFYGVEKSNVLKEQRSQSLKNRKITDETKLKLSSRVITDEWKQKISISNKGKTRTQEVKENISKQMSGLKHPRSDKKLYIFFNKSLNLTLIKTKYEMKKMYNMNSIHRIMQDKTKSCKGWNCLGVNPSSDGT